VSHQDIIKGTELHFEMGPTPKTNSVSDKDLTYSASTLISPFNK
jgi:putative alpha-1,2-mannosidase